MEMRGVGQLDEVKQHLYDTIDLDSNVDVTEERRFFTQSTSKLLSLSNLRGAGALERNKSFKVYGIQVDAHCSDSAKQELLALYASHSYIDLWIGEKSYFTAPLRHAVGKISHNFALGGGDVLTKDSFIQYGAAGANPITFQGPHAQEIGSQINFYMAWKVEGVSTAQKALMTPTADKPVRFVASLKGVLRRPVQ